MGRPKPKKEAAPAETGLAPDLVEALSAANISESDQKLLHDFGIVTVADLKCCEEGDLVEAGLKKFQARKLLKSVEWGPLPEELQDDLTHIAEQHAGEEIGETTNPVETFRSAVFNSSFGIDMQEAFRYIDDDMTGKVTYRNLRRVVQELNLNLSAGDTQSIIDDFDMDGDGELTEEEFTNLMNMGVEGKDAFEMTMQEMEQWMSVPRSDPASSMMIMPLCERDSGSLEGDRNQMTNSGGGGWAEYTMKLPPGRYHTYAHFTAQDLRPITVELFTDGYSFTMCEATTGGWGHDTMEWVEGDEIDISTEWPCDGFRVSTNGFFPHISAIAFAPQP